MVLVLNARAAQRAAEARAAQRAAERLRHARAAERLRHATSSPWPQPKTGLGTTEIDGVHYRMMHFRAWNAFHGQERIIR